MKSLVRYNPFSGNTFFSPFEDLFEFAPLLESRYVFEENVQSSLKDNILTYKIAIPETANLEELTAEVKDNVVTVAVPLKVKEAKKVDVKKVLEK